MEPVRLILAALLAMGVAAGAAIAIYMATKAP